MSNTDNNCHPTVKRLKFQIWANTDPKNEAKFLSNPKDFECGDLVGIHQDDEDFSHLLLRVNQTSDMVAKGSVHIDGLVAKTFHLKPYNDVLVVKINPQTVEVDMVELHFLEQYLSRSDMWVIKLYLTGEQTNVVYLERSFVYRHMRCTVGDMWRHGGRVACGIVTESTRIVFRSSSAQVFIFIQMSREMWEFDTQGDLYFEKCVNGFLPDLFKRWMQKKCSHFVTIIVFSRWFLKNISLESLPTPIKNQCRLDYKGRLFLDFYRLIVQNEYYDDWLPVLSKLKPLLKEYPISVKSYFKECFPNLPDESLREMVENSSAADGNFLEAINMSQNVFDKHYIDRIFERTGQTPVIVTAGSGIFHADREFANMTKQRVIDYGISLDLVCLGEQPLHAIPLLIFSKPNDFNGDNPEYNVPWWMNYSYYNPVRYSRACCSFVPRVKLPENLLRPVPISLQIKSCPLKTEEDFCRFSSRIMEPLNLAVTTDVDGSSSSQLCSAPMSPRKQSKPGDRVKHGGAIINPFKPANSTTIMSSNRRRWIHVFPTDKRGRAKQAHHYVPGAPVFSTDCENETSSSVDEKSLKIDHSTLTKKSISHTRVQSLDTTSVTGRANASNYSNIYTEYAPPLSSSAQTDNLLMDSILSHSVRSSVVEPHLADDSTLHALLTAPPPRRVGIPSGGSGCKVWTWGVTGEEQWNPELLIGVDWKSLTFASCFPLTTDYFPDFDQMKSYQTTPPKEFDFADHVTNEQKLQLFDQLVCQRLQQGFQIIILDKNYIRSALRGIDSERRKDLERKKILKEVYMSINREYHSLILEVRQQGNYSLTTSKFFYNTVKPGVCHSKSYTYQFRVPDSEKYENSTTIFARENRDMYNWNNLEQYIQEHYEYPNSYETAMDKSFKYWTARFFLLPVNHPSTKLIDKNKTNDKFNCDLYETFHQGEKMHGARLIDGIIRFLEYINKFKIRIRNSEVNDSKSLTRILSANDTKNNCDIPDSGYGDDSAPCLPFSLNEIGASATFERKSSVPLLSDKTTQKLLREITKSIDDPLPFQKDSSGLIIQLVQPIIEALLSSERGLSFIQDPKLPEATFVSAELVFWLMDNVEGLSNMNETLNFINEKLMVSNRIEHISGSDLEKEFKFGFYLYFIKQSGVIPKYYKKAIIECAFTLDNVCKSKDGQNGCLQSLRATKQNFQPRTSDEPCCLNTNWGVVLTNDVFCFARAFHVELQWLMVTGGIVGEMVSSWCRKADQYGFHLVPVPLDPFALPYNTASDTLRCPIFVPLQYELVKLLSGESLLRLQFTILCRFGFVRMNCERHSKSQEFVHLCGGMCVLVADSDTWGDNSDVDGQKPGFLWSWNFMLGKKHRENASNESFLDKMLADFRRFCANEGNRLSILKERICEDDGCDQTLKIEICNSEQ